MYHNVASKWEIEWDTRTSHSLKNHRITTCIYVVSLYEYSFVSLFLCYKLIICYYFHNTRLVWQTCRCSMYSVQCTHNIRHWLHKCDKMKMRFNTDTFPLRHSMKYAFVSDTKVHSVVWVSFAFQNLFQFRSFGASFEWCGTKRTCMANNVHAEIGEAKREKERRDKIEIHWI